MRLLTSSLLAVLLTGAVGIARADDGPPPPQPPGDASAHGHPGDQHEPETELGKQMEKMGHAFKKLRKQVGDASQNASSLELVATARKAAEESLTLTPAKAATLPEAERPKFIADYQDGIKQLIAKFDDLSAALKANNNEEAQKIFKDIGSFQRKEHHEFQKEHPHPPGPPPQGPAPAGQ
ncbi:MAG TPA: cytochrome b562 [Opitutaceae bacterium]